MTTKESWNEGFRLGMEWCEAMGKKPIGYKCKFWPEDDNGKIIDDYVNGFAEGKITGCYKFNVNFKWGTDDDVRNNIVERI